MMFIIILSNDYWIIVRENCVLGFERVKCRPKQVYLVHIWMNYSGTDMLLG